MKFPPTSQACTPRTWCFLVKRQLLGQKKKLPSFSSPFQIGQPGRTGKEGRLQRAHRTKEGKEANLASFLSLQTGDVAGSPGVGRDPGSGLSPSPRLQTTRETWVKGGARRRVQRGGQPGGARRSRVAGWGRGHGPGVNGDATRENSNRLRSKETSLPFERQLGVSAGS